MEVVPTSSILVRELTKTIVNGVQSSKPNNEPHFKQAESELDDEQTVIQNGPLDLTKVDEVDGASESTSLTNLAGAVRMSASLGENQELVVENQKSVETNGESLENPATVDNVTSDTVVIESDSASSSETDGTNIPGTSQGDSSLIIPATVDVEKLHIEPENIPSFSPVTSADNTGDEASACSSADASSGTSTPISKSGNEPSSILYKILTSKIQTSVTKDSNQETVSVLKTVPELPHRTPKVLMDPTAVKKTFKCRHCGRLFLKEYDFKQHERCHIQADEKPFQCPQCGKRYQTNSKLVVHMRIHTGEQPYQCSKCARRFMAAEYCKRHQATCDGMKRHARNINLLESSPNKKVRVVKTDGRSKTSVKKSSATAASSSRGSENKCGDKVFKCPNCYNKFSTKESFLKHIKQHENKHQDKADDLFTCKKCGKVYEKKSNLDKHMQLHEGSAPYTCKLCGFFCLRKYNFKMHMDCHRKQKIAKKMGSSYIKKFKCGVCMKGFQNAGHRAFHMKSHQTDKEANQSSESEPVAEWPNVQDKMSYGSKFSANCPHCKKHFKRKFDLLRHIKTHSKSVKFTCKYCNSTFTTKTNYIKHIHLHTSGENHTCRSCGLVYNKKVQKHRKEKLCWFKTAEAIMGLKGEKTSDSDELTTDYWNVMKPDPETCMWCDLTFNTKSNLYTHMRRHGTGNTCQWCGLEYKKEKQLHDPNFNCWLKTRQAVLKKEREKYQKTGTKPVDLLLGKDSVQDKETPASAEESKRLSDDKKMDLWRYECKYCDWAFVDNGNRLTHQRRHEEGNHSCRWCGLVYLKRRQKHDRNSRCWLTTREGRLQIAKDNKCGMKSRPPLSNFLNNLQSTSNSGRSFATFQPQDKKIMETDETTENWECDRCCKVFQTQPLLVNHMLLHSSEVKPYPCHKCDRSFRNQANLARHLMNHSFQCSMCLKRFEKEAQMKKHMTEVMHNFSCTRCARSYVRKVSLKYHVLRKHGNEDQKRFATASGKGSNKNFFCKHCGEGFDRASSLALHCRYNHKNKLANLPKDKNGLLKCSKCTKKFRFKSYLERHMQTHTLKWYKCHHCGLMLQKLQVYKKHMIEIHKEKPLTCFKCRQTFTDEALYNKHIENHEFSYTDQNSSEDGWSSEPGMPSKVKNKGGRPRKNQYQCSSCKKQFKQRVHYLVHRRSCQDNSAPSVGWKTNKCRYCSMSFLNTARLLTHVRNLHKQKLALEPFDSNSANNLACHLCGKEYLSLYSKNRHMRSAHAAEFGQMKGKKKQFQCRYCGQASKRLDFHVAHEKLHTKNIYKIQCKVCKIGFKCVEDLEEHGKAHAGFGKGKEVATQVNLTGTISKVRSSIITANQRPKKVTRPHVCRYCSLGFAKLTFLERHEQTHSTQSQPYSCRYCNMKFRRQAMLTKHEKLKHKEEETESEGTKPKTGPIVHADDYKGMSPNFTCRGCHKEFITQSGWEAHERNCLVKHGRKPIVFESDTTDVPDESATEMPKVGTSSDSASESETLPEASTDDQMKSHCKQCNTPLTGDKTENCDGCQAAAETANAVEHHGGDKKQEDTVWKCKECDQIFASKQCMETHMRFHTGMFPFKCSHCDEAFPRKDYLQRHERRDHGVDSDLKVIGELEGNDDQGSKQM